MVFLIGVTVPSRTGRPAAAWERVPRCERLALVIFAKGALHRADVS